MNKPDEEQLKLTFDKSNKKNRRFFKGSPNFGLVFIILGMLFLLIAGDETLLSCNRITVNQADCTIQSTLFGFIPKGSQQVDNVQSATVGENCTSRGCTYRPELVTTGGIIPLIPTYSAGTSGKEAVVNQVNAFLKSSQSETLTTSYGFATYLFFIPLLLIVFGLYTMISPVKSRRL